ITKRVKLLANWVGPYMTAAFYSILTLRDDGEVINDNFRLRHPREGGTTESGICLIQPCFDFCADEYD
ncbi:hypothetical protein AB6C59_22550, partial [Vibrio splendidus]